MGWETEGKMAKRLGVLIFLITVVGAAAAVPSLAASGSKRAHQPRERTRYTNGLNSRCPSAPTCAEIFTWHGYYTGHDEPAVLFYSNTKGAGNNNAYQLYLPKDPVKPPQSGGTANFQLHPAFWFGMAMCDTQSSPNPGGSNIGPSKPCKPDSDSNIFNGKNPGSPNYIGLHPGTAFMEMQFYPPGWAPFNLLGGISCDATKWCAALNIDSFSNNDNTGVPNNSACLNTVGIEPVNFAFITKDGHAQAPANPVDATAATYTPNPTRDLFMNSGDHISVSMHDTAAGFHVDIADRTTGQSGFMTASPSNGFAQVNYRPTASNCTVTPYAFHPMYATSSPKTRVPWAAHSYNIAFSDEIGHFEYCNNGAVEPDGTCAASKRTDHDGTDADDVFCLPASVSFRFPVSGCAGTDFDFDGPSYKKDWPGSSTNQTTNRRLYPTPVKFSSPLIGGTTNFSRVAFESDMPRVENFTTPPCQRFTTDPHPGAGCVNPPAGAKFYPFYSTTGKGTSCLWEEGGPHIPGTTNTFGGSSATEFGTKATGNLLQLFYPNNPYTLERIYEDFRNILTTNPCRAP
jgi:hypothetical protein